MPVNQWKTCTLCGKAGHNLRACPLPGAAKFRKLLANTRSHRTATKSRTLQGTGAAAARKVHLKKPSCKRPAASYKKEARKLYSGDAKDHSKRNDRCWTGPSAPRLSSEDAAMHLLQMGAFDIPKRCPKCGCGGLHGPMTHYKYEDPEIRGYWCDNQDCRGFTNIMQFCPLVADSFERHKTCTCAKLYALLCNYFAPEPPRLSRIVRASGLGEKPVLKIMDKLRAAEAALARKQCEEMRMSGRLEVDATKIRIAYVSKSNEFWQEHVAAWKASHPHARLPSYLISALD